MPPNTTDLNGVLFESDAGTPDMALPTAPVQQADNRPKQYVWRNIILFAYLHIAAVYGFYLFLFSAKWQTDVFGKLISFFISECYFLKILSGDMFCKHCTSLAC